MDATRILKRIAGVLISVIAVVYVAVHLVNDRTDSIETQAIPLVTAENKYEAESYVIRNETYLYSGTGGVLYYTVADGERVRKDQTVAEIYGNESDVDIQEQIRQIDRKISILEDSAVISGYVTTSLSKMDSNILSTILSINRDVASDRYVRAFGSSDSLLTMLNKRRLVTGQEKSYDSLISKLEGEKQILTGKKSSVNETVKTPLSGYFCVDADGLENVLTPGILDSVNVDGFMDLLTKAERKPTNLVGKIITDFEWKIVCLVDKKQAGEFLVGRSYPLVFPYSNDARIDGAMLTDKIIQTSSDTVLLIFTTVNIPDEFSFRRNQAVQIIRNSASGLRIPKNALRYTDGIPGVFVLSGSMVEYKKVEIVYTTDSFYIVKGTDEKNPLDIYDRLIVNGKELYDGKVVS